MTPRKCLYSVWIVCALVGCARIGISDYGGPDSGTTDSDSDNGSGDADGDTDTDGDADTDADSDGDTDSDSDTDSEEPPACVRRVDLNNGSGVQDGLSWSTAFNTIQPAIDSAAQAATPGQPCHVWVAQGTYYTYETEGDDSVVLQAFVELYGGFKGTETMLSQRDWVAFPTIVSGYDAGQSARVENVIRIEGESLLDGVIVTAGYAVEGDSNGHGGGLYNESQVVTVSNCTFHGNRAEAAGGAIANVEGGDLQLKNSFVYNNTSTEEASGISNEDSKLYIENTTIWNNYAMSRGGAILSQDNASLTIAHCTLFNNMADEHGGGIFSDDSQLKVVSSVIWGNSPEQIWVSGDIEISYSDVQGGYSGTNNIDADPAFTNPSLGDLSLKANSPCIDAALGTTAPLTDILGNSRVDDPATTNTGVGPPWADIGAYEFQP